MTIPNNKDQQQTIVTILRESQAIAVVGLSDNPERPSHDVARFLQAKGYDIIPVNPRVDEILGERAYSDLLSIPVPVDVVDIFRRPEAVPQIVEQAIQIGAKAIWMQKGIAHPEAEAKAKAAGLHVVSDRCMKIEYQHWSEEALLSRQELSS